MLRPAARPSSRNTPCCSPHLPGWVIIVSLVLTTAWLATPCFADSQLVIQEILYDGPGADGDDAFTELFGPSGAVLDGWTLVGVNGATGTPYRTVDLTGAVMPADGVLVVATASAAEPLAAVRDIIGEVDWQNGPDAVQLVDPAGVVVDALQYGDAGAFNAGEGLPAPAVSAGQSLSRDELGTDTDDNLADFSVLDPSTPGVGPIVVDPTITVTLPDTIAAGGDTLVVPVRLSDTSGLGLLAAELSLTYDGGLLTPLDVIPGDLLDTLAWNLVANVVEGQGTSLDTLRIALATDVDTLGGQGALVHVRFVVTDLHRPAQSDLVIEHLALNDGQPIAAIEDGAVGLVGVDATIAFGPVPVQIHDSLRVVITDADEDRDPTVLDIVPVRLSEGPEDAPAQQTEILLAVETGTSSGVFIGTVSIAYAAAVSGNGRIETAPRHWIELCYDDSLDAVGAPTSHCFTLDVPAHDGRLDVTVVAEPGDTLWLRLVDTDLNRRPDAVDTTAVTVIAPATADTLVVSLAEIAADDSVFFGYAVTRSVKQTVDSLRLTAAGGDSIRVSYLDLTPTDGAPVIFADTTFFLTHFGDADGNDQLQAFDASRVLVHVLTPSLSGRDSLAANIDSLAPFGAITPYDAALVLQQRVGLRHRFPVQASSAANHPQPDHDAQAAEPAVAGSRPVVGPSPPSAHLALATAPRQLSLRHETDYLSVWLDDRSRIVAGDLLLAGDGILDAKVKLAPDLRGYLLASRVVTYARQSPALRIVMAGAVPVDGPGELLRLYPVGAVGAAVVYLRSWRFNDGSVTVRLAAFTEVARQSRPVAFALHPNHPNPFNTTTVIPFSLPAAGHVQLEIHDVLGQRVRRLLAGDRPAGPQRVTWDGRDDRGRPAATGVYVLRMRAGEDQQSRRVLLLR